MLWGFSNLLASYLPANFTNQGNPVLYKKMNKLAYSNLKKLDHYHQQAYKKLLKEQDDILMSYLIAYESDAILQIANPEDVLAIIYKSGPISILMGLTFLLNFSSPMLLIKLLQMRESHLIEQNFLGMAYERCYRTLKMTWNFIVPFHYGASHV
jgi:hypothetical protein